MKKNLILLMAFLPGFSSAFADSPASPISYKKVSGNGRYVFVMLSPEPRQTFEGYQISGLYLNDGSKDPLWKIYWYAFGVEIASDGKHLVRLGPWPSDDDQEAISFFKNGLLLRTYKIKELVYFPSLMPHSISHFRWRAGEAFHDEESLFYLKTLHGDHYLLDVTTGKIIFSFRTLLWLAIIFPLILLLSTRLSRSLFLLILAIFSLFLGLLTHGVVFPVVVFFGLWVSGNIFSMLNNFALQLSQKWTRIITGIPKSKLLAIIALLMVFISLAGPAMVETRIQFYKPEMKSPPQPLPESSEDYLNVTIAKEGNYTAYSYGIVADEKTGLEWITGPKSLNWEEARTWAENQSIGGGGWRLPTPSELQTLYQERNGRRSITPLLQATGMFAWSDERRSVSSAEALFFETGASETIDTDYSYDTMVLAVRSGTAGY